MLIDTHVVLWLVGAPDRLGSRTVAAIREADQVCVSSVSLAEMRIKQLRGKLDLPDDFEQRLRASGFKELALDWAHTTRLTDFPGLSTHDPFDRVLLSQASGEGMEFVTADAVLLRLGLSWVRDAGQ